MAGQGVPEPHQVGRVVLQVGVQRRDPISSGGANAGHCRRRLTNADCQPHSTQLRINQGQIIQYRSSLIGRRVIDDDNLETARPARSPTISAQRTQRPSDLGHQLRQAFRLVFRRHHNRQKRPTAFFRLAFLIGVSRSLLPGRSIPTAHRSQPLRRVVPQGRHARPPCLASASFQNIPHHQEPVRFSAIPTLTSVFSQKLDRGSGIFPRSLIASIPNHTSIVIVATASPVDGPRPACLRAIVGMTQGLVIGVNPAEHRAVGGQGVAIAIQGRRGSGSGVEAS